MIHESYYTTEASYNLVCCHDSRFNTSDTFLKKKENKDAVIQQMISLSIYYVPSSGLEQDVVCTPKQLHLLGTALA